MYFYKGTFLSSLFNIASKGCLYFV